MGKGRLPETDISDEQMQQFLESNAHMPMTAEEVFRYRNLNTKARGRWHELYAHRGALLELFRLSGGMGLHQKHLAKQMLTFFLSTHMKDPDISGAEKTAYRLRCMMSHLHAHKKADRRPPQRFIMMTAILDWVVDDRLEPSAHSAPLAQVASAPTSDLEMLVPIAQPTECIMIESDIDDDIDDEIYRLECELFEETDVGTPVKPKATAEEPVVETPEKTCVPPPMLDDEQIDAMLFDPVRAPFAAEYKALRKKPSGRVLKKPVASKSAAADQPVTTDDARLLKKRIYSKAYHAVYDPRQKSAATGKELAEAKLKGAIAGRKAVDAMNA